MLSNLADLHRSRLETLLAIEVEYQRKLIALSNQRIGAIKKLLTDVDALHQDLEGDELLSMGSGWQAFGGSGTGMMRAAAGGGQGSFGAQQQQQQLVEEVDWRAPRDA